MPVTIQHILENLSFMEKLNQGGIPIVQSLEMHYQYNARELIFQYKKVKLYHYQAKVELNLNHSVPLLIVFATVNRPEILDLFPDRSFIGYLLEMGLEIYLLDWGCPDIEDQYLSFNDYVTDHLQHCVQYILVKKSTEKINLLGICQGGLIALAYSSLFTHIKNLILISTPIDFSTHDNVITHLCNGLDIEAINDIKGNIPGLWLKNFFVSVRPFELQGKYLRFIDHLSDQKWINKFLRVEKWLHDVPDQTRFSFVELIKELYAQNKLIKGQWYLGNKRIDLTNLKMPVLNIMATQDEIIPISASRVLQKYIANENYTQKLFPSGHIGIYISDKIGKNMPKAIAHWLKNK
jgi:polyhydroxyalkanoate synthase